MEDEWYEWDEWDNEFDKPYHQYYNSMNEIVPGLFLSDYVAASNLENIYKNGIKKIISLGGYDDHPKYSIHDGIEYLFVFIDDYESEPISQHFNECNQFIKSSRSSSSSSAVLVHCYAGISRSATIVIAYLMSTGMTFNDAYQITKTKRPCINPNPGFMRQVKGHIVPL
jgi:hypothetical protein